MHWYQYDLLYSLMHFSSPENNQNWIYFNQEFVFVESCFNWCEGSNELTLTEMRCVYFR